MYLLKDETGIEDYKLYKNILKQINLVNKRGFFESLFSKKIKIEEAKKLKYLWVSNCGEINNLEFLRYFQSLKELNLSECEGIKDISGIRYLENLETLYIYDTNILDPSPIGEVTSLESFDYYVNESELNKNTTHNFDYLRTLHNLKNIDLCEGNISDVSFLLVHKNLKVLSLSDNPIENFSILSELSGLEELAIDGCDLTSLDGIEKFSSLKRLYAYDNQLDEEQKEYYRMVLSGLDKVEL